MVHDLPRYLTCTGRMFYNLRYTFTFTYVFGITTRLRVYLIHFYLLLFQPFPFILISTGINLDTLISYVHKATFSKRILVSGHQEIGAVVIYFEPIVMQRTTSHHAATSVYYLTPNSSI